MKVESIPFRSFMANDYQIKSPYFSASTLYSVNTVVSIGALLNPPPMIAGAYVLMFAVGVVTIGLAAMEHLFINSQLFEVAKGLVNVFKTLMPFVLIGVLAYFVYGNPLL